MRVAVRVIGIVLLLLVLVVVSLPFLIGADRFKPPLETALSNALARRVTIGNLQVSLLSGGVAADSLAIAEDPAFGAAPFLQAKSLKIGVRLWPLLVSRQLDVTSLTIDQPQVALLQSPSGRWNYSSLGGASAEPSAPAAKQPGQSGMKIGARLVRIVGGRFTIGKSGTRQKPLVLENVNLEVRDFAPNASFLFTFSAKVAGGGNINLSGNAGPIDPTDVELTPASVTLDIAGLNLASALAGTAPDIAGTAFLQASGNSTGGRLTLKGKLRAEKLKLAKNGTPARRPVEFDFAAEHDLRAHQGSLQRGDVHAGSASASLTGKYAQRGNSTVLDTRFTGTKMPVPELAELLPPLGIALPNGSRLEGGTATAVFSVQGPADRLIAEGSLSLDNTRLANFDLGNKITVIEKLAGVKSGPNTDIETFNAKLRYSPEGTAVEALRFLAPGIGELNGAGTVSPANDLAFKMSATIQTTRSAALSSAALPFFVEGTAMNPVFRPDVRNIVKSEAKSLLKSGVLDTLLGGKKKK